MNRKVSAAANLPQDYEAMIAVAAYYKAEQRGFAPGREIDDWLDAKGELDGRLDDLLRKKPTRTRRPATKTPEKAAKRTRKKQAVDTGG